MYDSVENNILIQKSKSKEISFSMMYY